MKGDYNIHTTEVITHSIPGFDGNENDGSGCGEHPGNAGRGGGTGTDEG